MAEKSVVAKKLIVGEETGMGISPPAWKSMPELLSSTLGVVSKARRSQYFIAMPVGFALLLVPCLVYLQRHKRQPTKDSI